MDELLKINNLHVSYHSNQCDIDALKGIYLSLHQNECIGIIGESGSGKSTLADSILNILSSSGRIRKGEIIFDDIDITKISEKALNKIRGNEISIVFQNPMSSLNPVLSIAEQLTEHYESHTKVSKAEAYTKAIEMLNLVQIPIPIKIIKKYPHQCSGGELQRIMIAIALMCNPKILIADEITSALDLATQKQIIKLLKDLKNRLNMSIVFITHDLRAAASICNRIYVMHEGIIVESGLTQDIFTKPSHPYTKELLSNL